MLAVEPPQCLAKDIVMLVAETEGVGDGIAHRANANLERSSIRDQGGTAKRDGMIGVRQGRAWRAKEGKVNALASSM
jgi:hypothetical protein